MYAGPHPHNGHYVTVALRSAHTVACSDSGVVYTTGEKMVQPDGYLLFYELEE
jgi:ubiquitin C-terminal hydrolase